MPPTHFPTDPADYSRRILVTTSDLSLSTITDVLHRIYKHSASGFPTELWILHNGVMSEHHPGDIKFYLTTSNTSKIKVVQKSVKEYAETTEPGKSDQALSVLHSTADNIQNLLSKTIRRYG